MPRLSFVLFMFKYRLAGFFSVVLNGESIVFAHYIVFLFRAIPGDLK